MKKEKSILQDLFSNAIEEKDGKTAYVQIMLSNVEIKDSITIEIRCGSIKKEQKDDISK